MGKSTAIRGDWKSEWAGKLAGCLIRLLGMSLRMRMDDRAGVTDKDSGLGPMLMTVWHDTIFVMPYAKLKFFKHRDLVVLTSASKDGAILANAMAACGMGAVRGSSSRRAVAALVALRKALKAGRDVAITPDGPRGPRHKLQPGVIKLAEATGASIVVGRVKFHNCWRLKTWDKFAIPKPFSRVDVVLEKAYTLPRGLDDEAFQREAAALEKKLIGEGEVN